MIYSEKQISLISSISVIDSYISAETRISNWIMNSKNFDTLLINGDSFHMLDNFPTASIDTIITSPPYWNQRSYSSNGIGLENEPKEYISNLLAIMSKLYRCLKPDGSFWLNLGDSYHKKSLAGIPWRVALKMIDEQGWILRNDVIWSKVKGGMDTSRDRLSNTHEMLFHFVKQSKYWFDMNSIRTRPREAKIVNGAVVSATGVTGVNYRRKIELSTELSLVEKANATKALEDMIEKLRNGDLSDFRMVIRGAGQRVTHSDQGRVSGRAKELNDKGFYFLRYHPDGAKPSDVWEIVPEDTQQRDARHYAAFPKDLCRIPILATCPKDGIILDPFAGTGTTLVAACEHGRRSVGIDISSDYVSLMEERLS